LKSSVWQEALKLLNFQIQQKKSNRHFNTLSMFYYERLANECLTHEPESYYLTKVASSLFYGLEKEFFAHHYVIPKKGLGLRDYVFFTYPMRALYYAVGLYLLKLSQEFLLEVHKKLKNVSAYYGGNLHYKRSDLVLSKENIYYRSFYDEFTQTIEQEVEQDKQDKVVIKLDIENYFGEISIPLLLEKLDHFVKPSIKVEMRFDVFTKEQICFFFEFLMNEKTGIPQAENNIISSFIGHLFMAIGDFLIDDLMRKYDSVVMSHKIIRYVDDIYISIRFQEEVSRKKQGEFTLAIASEIAEVLYGELGLRLNLKTKAYHLFKEEEKEELLTRVKTLVSQDGAGFDYDFVFENDIPVQKQSIVSKEKELSPQDEFDRLVEELEKIKDSNIEDYFIRSNSDLLSDEIFQVVFKKSVYNLAGKPENLEKIRKVFEGFNFDLIKARPFEVIIILLKEESTAKRLKGFLLRKEVVTTSDADLIIKYLCQRGFSEEDQDLLNKLSENKLLKDIISLILNSDTMCGMPGYHELSCMNIRKISRMPEVIDQIKLRVFNERMKSFSVALSHLLNEIHALCIRQENADKKEYDANAVFSYLVKRNVPCETRVKIRNLFDRRNSNGVSHPGSDNHMAWEVTKEEYLDYYKHVGLCFDKLL
jgi:AbiA family abortive infection protein